MPTAHFSDLDLYYETYGQGQPLVLISGYTCDHRFWTSLVDALAQQFHAVVFDNRGIGQTQDHGGSFSLETCAQDTLRLLDHLQLSSPVIVGQSMGGAIAQILAHHHSDRISSCILLNTVQTFNVATLKALESLLYLREVGLAPEQLVEATLPWVFSKDFLAQKEQVAAFKTSALNPVVPQSVFDQQRQFNALQAFDSSRWGQTMQVPSLVIGAKDDRLTPLAECKALAHQLQASFQTIPGGHASPLEQPNLLVDILSHWILPSQFRLAHVQSVRPSR